MSTYWWVMRKEDVAKLVKANIDDIVPLRCATRSQLSGPLTGGEHATVQLRVTQKWSGDLDDKHGGPLVCLQGQLSFHNRAEVRVYSGYSGGVAIMQVA